MPSGRTHFRLWKYGFSVATLVSSFFLVQGRYKEAICVFAGYALGGIVDPDMDMTQNTRAKKIWSLHLLLLPLYPWWLVYSWVATHFLGGHRSIATHLPGLSTGLRMIWLGLPIMVIISVLSTSSFSMRYSSGTDIREVATQLMMMVYWSWIGLTISDTIHFVADLIRRD